MSGHRRLVVLTIVVGLGVACSSTEMPLTPEESPSPRHRLSIPGSTNSETSGGTIWSVSDGAGLTVTLDESNKTLRLSTGEWVTLDDAVAADVLADFEGILSTDPARASLGAAVASWSDPYADCYSGGECATLRAADSAGLANGDGPRPQQHGR